MIKAERAQKETVQSDITHGQNYPSAGYVHYVSVIVWCQFCSIYLVMFLLNWDTGTIIITSVKCVYIVQHYLGMTVYISFVILLLPY